MAGGRPLIIPSDAYRKYAKAAKKQVSFLSLPPTITEPVWVKCLYYMETARMPDLTNLLAATQDILEACGIIANDSQIKSVDGSRIMGKDKDPRVEIYIQTIPIE